MQIHAVFALNVVAITQVTGAKNMKSINITVQHKVGLHARPAALFVQTAQKHESKITVTSNEKAVNAKSLLGLLSLGVTQGTTILIAAEGADEKEALETLKLLVESNFGE